MRSEGEMKEGNFEDSRAGIMDCDLFCGIDL